MKIKNISLSFIQLIFIVLTAACAVMIFRFSMEDAEDSSETSGNVVEVVVKVTHKDFDTLPTVKQESILSRTDHAVRKSAHFSIFAALGFCASCAAGRRRLLSILTGAVLGFCFLYACSDELHQYFVPGRACRFTDVLIDTSGAVLGTLVSMIFCRKKERKTDQQHLQNT